MVTILFVDDQPLVLDGIRRMLLSHRRAWNMRFATSGEEALRVCAAETVDVIVSDMRMPEMDGATLLAAVAERHPDTIRIVLSGHSEIEAALRAMDVAHQYLAKPCEGPAIARTLERALRQRERLPRGANREVVNRLRVLPSMPAALRRLKLLLAEPSPPPAEVVTGLSHDPALAGKVLQLANSAFFGPTQRVSSLSVACSLLGLSSLRHLVAQAEQFSPPTPSNGACTLDVTDFEEHSRETASIAARLEPESPWCDDAFSAGLLHDLGVLVVAARLPVEFCEIQRRVESGEARSQAERAVIGAHHGELAGYLLGLWGLPDEIVDAVAGHVEFDPGRVDELDVAVAVGVADQLARERHAGHGRGRARPTGELWNWWREQANSNLEREAA